MRLAEKLDRKGLNAQHVSSDTPLITRSSKTVIAASGFTFVCGCHQLSWYAKVISYSPTFPPEDGDKSILRNAVCFPLASDNIQNLSSLLLETFDLYMNNLCVYLKLNVRGFQSC
jgi:hypothetical protein